MNTKEWADLLHGREYRNELTREQCNQAKLEGIVIVTGYSDDGMDFDGAIRDEVSVYDGGTVYLTPAGLLESECREGIDCPYFKEEQQRAATIKAVWCPESDPGVSWVYETTIPHETLDIMMDGEVYCRGIVFRLADVALAMPAPSHPAPDVDLTVLAKMLAERALSMGMPEGSLAVKCSNGETMIVSTRKHERVRDTEHRARGVGLLDAPAGWRIDRINGREISIIDANGSRTVVFGSSTTSHYERTLYALAAALLAQDGDK